LSIIVIKTKDSNDYTFLGGGTNPIRDPRQAAEYQRSNYGVRPHHYVGVSYHGEQVFIITTKKQVRDHQQATAICLSLQLLQNITTTFTTL
jgi:hypothetical protein